MSVITPTASSSSISTTTQSINVVARLRPLEKPRITSTTPVHEGLRCIVLNASSDDEADKAQASSCTCYVDKDTQATAAAGGSSFTFDKIFDENATQ
eukprot:2052049-Pyramimonas_sp.AAC.1